MVFDTTKQYKMPSSLGGSFSLKYLREESGDFVFKITNQGWEREVRFTAETVSAVKQQTV